MIDRKQKILIIDDDITILALVEKFLTKSGYECICANGGSQGLERLLNDKPELILLDYLMPGFDGGQVYNEIITNPAYSEFKNIPVIIVTAKESDITDKTRFLKGGVSAYLQKPFGLQELKNVIENVFIISEIKTKNIQLQAEIQQTNIYLELLFNTTPVGIISSDEHGIIKRVNSYLMQVMELHSHDNIIGKNILELSVFNDQELIKNIEKILSEGKVLEDFTFNYITSKSDRIYLRMNGVPLKNNKGIAGSIITIQNVTETERKQLELDMLSQISNFMQGAHQLDQLLHLILTAMTAGCALGFSRAMIFLINSETNFLECKMGVGPANQQEAHDIWSNMAQETIALPDFILKYGLKPFQIDSSFNQIVKKLKIPLNKLDPILVEVIENKIPKKVNCNNLSYQNCADFFNKIRAEEFIIVPLIAKYKVIGLVLADNQFSARVIDDNMVELLKIFANQAGLAVERAEAYQDLETKKNKLEKAYKELEETQERLVHAEKLATVGKMAAQIAHEVRNPLVAVGGFARNILKNVQSAIDKGKLETYANIIYDEVNRLENILKNILDFSKLSQPNVSKEDINKIITDVCLFINNRKEISTTGITIVKNLDDSLPLTLIDPQQIKQVLLNICQNAVHSMSNGGILTITTRRQLDDLICIKIHDTGVGMSPQVLEEMFNPFFTTKKDGTGLGLSISQQIIESHSGTIDVNSEVGKGTTFNVTLKITDNIDQFNQILKSSPISHL